MFQVSAQARRLAGIPGISYTGWSTHTRRIETLEGPAVFDGEHVSDAVLSLMAVGHYQDPRLGERNLAWKSAWLAPGAVLQPASYDRLATGDILFYPDYGPGHFGIVLLRERQFLLVVEGYWKGQATVLHLYPRSDAPERCMAASLRRLRGFAELSSELDGRVTWARNVVPAAIRDKGRLRVAAHR
jgi:hypothetical protein